MRDYIPNDDWMEQEHPGKMEKLIDLARQEGVGELEEEDCYGFYRVVSICFRANGLDRKDIACNVRQYFQPDKCDKIEKEVYKILTGKAK